MRKHFFRKSSGDLIFTDTLETVNLNETAQFIYQGISESKDIQTIAKELAALYGVSVKEVSIDVAEMVKQFQDLGIESVAGRTFNPHTVILHIIQNCNSPCQLCDCWKTKGKVRHSYEELRPLIDWLATKDNKNVMVSGGEPLLHPQVQQICTEINSLGMRVLLNTNGLLLHKAKWISSSIVSEVVVSMDGYDPNSYKVIRGIDGYERVWENISELKQQNPNLTVSARLILNKINLFNLPTIFAKAKELGVARVGVSPLDISSPSFGRTDMNQERSAKLQSQFLPNHKEIDQFRSMLTEDLGELIEKYFIEGLSDWSKSDYLRCLDYYEGTLNQVQTNNSDVCLFPINSMVIDYDGGLKPCFYSKSVTDISTPEKYDEKYNQQIETLKTSGQCNNCRGKVFCDVRISS